MLTSYVTRHLGATFLHSAYVVFDRDNQNIHLAQSCNSATHLVAAGSVLMPFLLLSEIVPTLWLSLNQPLLHSRPSHLPEPTVTPVPTVTPEPTVTPQPTVTPEPTVNPEPTVTLQQTLTPELTVTPEPTTVAPEPSTTDAGSLPRTYPVPPVTPPLAPGRRLLLLHLTLSLPL